MKSRPCQFVSPSPASSSSTASRVGDPGVLAWACSLQVLGRSPGPHPQPLGFLSLWLWKLIRIQLAGATDQGPGTTKSPLSSRGDPQGELETGRRGEGRVQPLGELVKLEEGWELCPPMLALPFPSLPSPGTSGLRAQSRVLTTFSPFQPLLFSLLCLP